jgi:hypothetical protein
MPLPPEFYTNLKLKLQLAPVYLFRLYFLFPSVKIAQAYMTLYQYHLQLKMTF